MFFDFITALFKKKPVNNIPETDLAHTVDGVVWAKDFMLRFGERKNEIDEGLMIAWFANALQAGIMHGAQKERERAKEEYQVEKVRRFAELYGGRKHDFILDGLERHNVLVKMQEDFEKSKAHSVVEGKAIAVEEQAAQILAPTPSSTYPTLNADEVQLLQEYINQRLATFPNDGDAVSIETIQANGEMTLKRLGELQQLQSKLGFELHRRSIDLLQAILDTNLKEFQSSSVTKPDLVKGSVALDLKTKLDPLFVFEDESSKFKVKDLWTPTPSDKLSKFKIEPLSETVVATINGKAQPFTKARSETKSEEVVGAFSQESDAEKPKESDATGPKKIELDAAESMLLKKYAEIRQKWVHEGGTPNQSLTLLYASKYLTGDQYSALRTLELKINRNLSQLPFETYTHLSGLHEGDKIALFLYPVQVEIDPVDRAYEAAKSVRDRILARMGDQKKSNVLYQNDADGVIFTRKETDVTVPELTEEEFKALGRYCHDCKNKGVWGPRTQLCDLLAHRVILEPEYRLLRNIEIKLKKPLDQCSPEQLVQLGDHAKETLEQQKTDLSIDKTVRLTPDENELLRLYASCVRAHAYDTPQLCLYTIKDLYKNRWITDREHKAMDALEHKMGHPFYQFSAKNLEEFVNLRVNDRVEIRPCPPFPPSITIQKFWTNSPVKLPDGSVILDSQDELVK